MTKKQQQRHTSLGPNHHQNSRQEEIHEFMMIQRHDRSASKTMAKRREDAARERVQRALTKVQRDSKELRSPPPKRNGDSDLDLTTDTTGTKPTTILVPPRPLSDEECCLCSSNANINSNETESQSDLKDEASLTSKAFLASTLCLSPRRAWELAPLIEALGQFALSDEIFQPPSTQTLDPLPVNLQSLLHSAQTKPNEAKDATIAAGKANAHSLHELLQSLDAMQHCETIAESMNDENSRVTNNAANAQMQSSSNDVLDVDNVSRSGSSLILPGSISVEDGRGVDEDQQIQQDGGTRIKQSEKGCVCIVGIGIDENNSNDRNEEKSTGDKEGSVYQEIGSGFAWVVDVSPTLKGDNDNAKCDFRSSGSGQESGANHSREDAGSSSISDSEEEYDSSSFECMTL